MYLQRMFETNRPRVLGTQCLVWPQMAQRSNFPRQNPCGSKSLLTRNKRIKTLNDLPFSLRNSLKSGRTPAHHSWLQIKRWPLIDIPGTSHKTSRHYMNATLNSGIRNGWVFSATFPSLICYKSIGKQQNSVKEGNTQRCCLFITDPLEEQQQKKTRFRFRFSLVKCNDLLEMNATVRRRPLFERPECDSVSAK